MNEFSLIEKYFRPLTRGRAEALALKDDAAVFAIPKNHELVVTSDTLSAGVHFLKDEKPEFVAHKALRVNLSDLAAMGAAPLAYQLCVAFPAKPSEKWVRAFTRALLKDQKEFGIFCSGGDTTVIKGPLTISITAFGAVPRGEAVKRSGAKPGDALVITGAVGNALAGLRILQNKIPLTPTLSLKGEGELRRCVGAYQKPIPRLAAAPFIRRYASAAIDISDGLIADVGHICEASKCGARIDVEKMQFSAPVKKYLSIEDAITGGDDYELALAVPQRNLPPLLKNLRALGMAPQVIGAFMQGAPDVAVFDKSRPLKFKKPGWTHF